MHDDDGAKSSNHDSGFQDDDDEESCSDFLNLLILQNQQMSNVLMKSLAVVADLIASNMERKAPIPYHTSILTGEMWMLELLSGHPDRIRSELGVHRHVFFNIIDVLKFEGYHSSRRVSLEEQLGIFLYTCVTGLSCRHVRERFQRSNNTISKYFRRMLEAFTSPDIYHRFVRLPRGDDPTPSRIADDPSVYPFFKDAIGAIDGTHIACAPSKAEREATRNRKGFHSQNCLVCCNFDLEFMYILSGWEGSAADATVYHDARTSSLRVPPGKYYLADAGYPICPQLLVPYRGIQYHLPEWERSQIKPKNAQEYFNFRHAQLRNVVERIIGVLKRRFRILVIPPEYSMDIQARVPPALCCIHNMVRRYDPNEYEVAELERDVAEALSGLPPYHPEIYGEMAKGFISTGERDEMTEKREEIAQSLWEDHLNYVHANTTTT